MCLSQQRSRQQIPAGRNSTSQGTAGEIYHRKNGRRLETQWKCQERCQGDATPLKFYRGSVPFYCQQSKVTDSVNQTSIFIQNDTDLWIRFFENLLSKEALQTSPRWKNMLFMLLEKNKTILFTIFHALPQLTLYSVLNRLYDYTTSLLINEKSNCIHWMVYVKPWSVLPATESFWKLTLRPISDP